MADNEYSLLDTSGGNVTYRFDREQHARNLLDNLNIMQAGEGKSKPFLTDISVCGWDNVVVPFHSVVLAACSSTIQDTLASGSFAKYANGEFVIRDVTSAGVEVLRDFAYGCDVSVTDDTVDQVRKIAALFTIDDLDAVCESYERKAAGDSNATEVEHSFEDRASEVLDAIYEMWRAEQLTDVVLQDEGQETELHCHKSCLAAASPQFRDLLQSKHIKRQGAIPIKGLSTNALNSLIGYIYTAEVRIDSENVKEILINSCNFLLPDVVKAACDWLERVLTHENAIDILKFAQFVQSDQESVERLHKTAFDFIVENFSDIVETSDEFVTMPLDDLTQVISENDLAVESEEEVFHAIMKWVKHDEERRKHDLAQLLTYVRLEKTADDFLEEVEQDPLIQKSPSCLDILEAAKTGDSNPSATEDSRSADDSLSSKSLPPFDDNRPLFDDNQSVASAETLSSVGEDLEEQHYYDREIDYVNYEKANRPTDPNGSASVVRKLIFSSDETPRRKNGQLDLRYKKNRESCLGKALNKDGSLDQRTREYKEYVTTMKPAASEVKSRVKVPLTKSGRPDMRFSINKKIFKRPELVNQRNSNSTAPRFLKKDGTPDMRFSANKAVGRAPSGPSKKNGTPDRRFKANKAIPGCYPSVPTVKSSGHSLESLTGGQGSSRSVVSSRVLSYTTYSSGPLKKDGTPDMRYASNKSFASHSSSNSCGYSSYGASSFTPSGPLKNDGTPDMRYKANRR